MKFRLWGVQVQLDRGLSDRFNAREELRRVVVLELEPEINGVQPSNRSSGGGDGLTEGYRI